MQLTNNLLHFLFLFLCFNVYGQTPTAPSAGLGTLISPYEIASLDNLYWIGATDAEVPTPSLTDRLAAHYVIVADIDASPTSTWFSGAGWRSIGNSSNPFRGTLNGDGFTISNLFINRPAETGVGLIGQANGSSGQVVRIRSLTLEDIDVTGQRRVGGVIGFGNQFVIVDGVIIKGKITGRNEVGGIYGFSTRSTTIRSGAEVEVRVGGNTGTATTYHGGLIGHANSNSAIEESYSIGSVEGEWRIGGLVGAIGFGVIVEDCYSRASTRRFAGSTRTDPWIGGLVGEVFRATLRSSYSTGLVETTGLTSFFGGLVGLADDGGFPSSLVDDRNFWDEQTSGLATSAMGVGKTTLQMNDIDTFTDDLAPLAPWNFSSIWEIDPPQNDGYPTLQWQVFPISIFEWTAGAGNTDFLDPLNWDTGVSPIVRSEIIIPSGLPFYPELNTDFEVGQTTIETGANLTINPGVQLSLFPGNPIIGGGSIILKSDATGDGSIGRLFFCCAVQVDIIMERYIEGGNRAFRFLSHPFDRSIPLSELATQIDITGDGGAANGFTTTDTNQPSAFKFNPAFADDDGINDSGWIPFTSTLETIDQYQAIRILVRGAKGQAGSLLDVSYTPDPVTLSFEGKINSGNAGPVEVPLRAATIGGETSDWNLVGNPYPSAINLQLLDTQSADNDVAVWDPRAGDISGTLITGAGRGGAYIQEPIVGSGEFIIPSGSGFFIKALANGNEILFEELMKVKGDPATFEHVLRKEKVASAYGPNSLQLVLTSQGQYFDKTILRFRETTANYNEPEDGAKFANPIVNFFTLSEDDYALAIDDRPYDIGTDYAQIPLWVMSPKNTYTINVSDLDIDSDKQLLLYDRFTKKEVLLEKGMTYDFEVTEDPKSRNHRFDIVMGAQVVTSIADPSSTLKLFLMPNPAQHTVAISFQKLDDLTNAEIRILNLQGVPIRQFTIAAHEEARVDVELNSLNKGIYLVELRQGSHRLSKRLIVN